MARRKTALDAFIDAYLELDPQERPFAMAAIKGADKALRTQPVPKAETQTFEELGAAAAAEDAGE